MSTVPTFTVVAANFNSGDKLQVTLDSVMQQCVNLELFIVDGGSTDNSIKIARWFASNHPTRVRLWSEPDKGIYDAMNKGIAAARGQFIYFIGAGDHLVEGALWRVAGLLPHRTPALVYGDVLWNEVLFNGKYNWRKLIDKNIPHQGSFFSRDIFDRIGPYELQYRILADWAMNFAIFGDRCILKLYIGVLIANYEGSGVSATTPDTLFMGDFKKIARRLGAVPYAIWRIERACCRLSRVLRHVVRKASGR